MDAAGASRLALAKSLRELADGSTEAMLRERLSRSYYSVFHAAYVLFGRVDHSDVAKKVGTLDSRLESQVRKLQQLRMQADYDPNFLDREFKGKFERFQVDARQQIDDGLIVFNRIVAEIERKSGT